MPKAGCGNKYAEKCEGCKVRKMDQSRYVGTSRFHQLDIHFAIKAKAAALLSSEKDGVITIEVGGADAETFIAFSLTDQKTAEGRLDEAMRIGFYGSRREAADRWERALSRVRVRFSDDALRRRFYSTLYFSFVKPIDTEIGFLDYFTLWDVYRTQLPLVLSVFPKTARRMMDDMMSVSEKHGFYPIARYMTGHRLGRDNGQAADQIGRASCRERV